MAAWYRRYEVQLRLGYYYLGSMALSAFSNILAYGLVQIGNHTTWKGWRWLYIIEGVITSLFGILAFFYLVDFPESKKVKFLTEDEKRHVRARLAAERGTHEEHRVTFKSAFEALCDWKVWANTYMYMSATMGSYAFSFFLPIILKKSLGYSQAKALLLTTPPYIFTVCTSIVSSRLSDKFRMRGPFVAAQAAIGIVGMGMIGYLKQPTPR